MTKAIVGAIIAVVVIGGGIYWYTNNNGSNESGDTSDHMAINDNDAGSGSNSTPKSLREAMEQYKNKQCTYSDETGSGLVYVGNGNMRGDFISTGTGSQVNSHMIVDADSVYVWQDNETQGFKMALSAMTQAEANQNVDIDKEQDFDCSNWNPDSGKFNLPSTVSFSDYTEMMQQVQTQNQIPPTSGPSSEDDLKQQQCGVCAGIPDAATKAQCLAQFSC